MCVDSSWLSWVPWMPTNGILLGLCFRCSGPLGLPVSASRDEEGIDLLLGDEVRPTLPLAECTKTVLHNGSSHLVWVHLQHLCDFFNCVVLDQGDMLKMEKAVLKGL